SEQPLQQQAGVSNGRVKAEEEDGYDCDDCHMSFRNERTFVAHMRTHGYELADPDEAHRIDAGENIAGPSAKKPKIEEEEGTGRPQGSSNGRPKYPKLPGNDDEEDFDQCEACGAICLTTAEYSAHLRRCIAHQGSILKHACSICKKSKFETVEELKAHEVECRTVKAVEARDKSLHELIQCPYCGKKQNNAFVLGSHIASEHSDIIKWLRFHHLVASEFLPFRCSSCNVGFEDARLLLDHFRLREEFGKGCEGYLLVHDYQYSLHVLDTMKKTEKPARIPDIPKLGDMDYDIYADIFQNEYCPCELPPPLRKDSTLLRRCVHCTEVWPIVQMKWHIKMEHPKFYFDSGSFKCKTCKQFHFYDPSQYADHFENCIVDNYKISNDKLLDTISRNFNPEKPSMQRGKNDRPLKTIPENIGNEMRPCRFCKDHFSPEGLLLHLKNEHTLEHFTDAPYLCGRCDEVGFYSHQEYKRHGTRCTGQSPTNLLMNIYAITAQEVENRTGTKRIEIPSYRALIGEERRKYGTFTSFNRTHNCPNCEHWCTSMETMGEHFKDAHKIENETLQPFLCGGCGIVFADTADLRRHLRNQEILGNVQCYDMATTHRSVNHTIANNANLLANQALMTLNPVRYMKAPPYFRPSANQPTFSTPPIMLNRRPHFIMDPNRQNAHNEFGEGVSLSRQIAAQKRHNHTLLPIRPLSQLSKSPLSGERHQQTRMMINANLVRAQNTTYFAQLAANERQKSFTRVDFSTPLSLPSRSSYTHRITVDQFDPRQPLLSEPAPPSRLIGRSMPARPTTGLNAAAAARPIPQLMQHTQRPSMMQTAKFRLAPTSSPSSGGQGAIRFRPMSAAMPSRPFVRPMAPGTGAKILAPPAFRGTAQPKTEPKQEPL
ncbi:hypothetical protein PFISCL1PPCAC_26603, partial [Pristionchus fissidentatus]